MLIFVDNLEFKQIRALTTNDFLAKVVESRYLLRVNAYKRVLNEFGTPEMMMLIRSGLETYLQGFVEYLSTIEKTDDYSSMCSCTQIRSVYNQIKKGTFFYTGQSLTTQELMQQPETPLPPILENDCKTCPQ